MAVRRIGLCYRSVGGRVPMGRGHPAVSVESSLERDFVLLQRFDPAVAGIAEQPARIYFRDRNGTRRHYVPDFLVSYRAPGRQSNLVEVKLSDDRQLVSGALEERFAAARAYAPSRGWSFSVVTEKAIRTPILTNAKFLLPFRERSVDHGFCARLVCTLHGSAGMTAKRLLEAAFPSEGERVAALPALWHLVATFRFATDLEVALTMESILSAGVSDHVQA
jgi:hypothetical protein